MHRRVPRDARVIDEYLYRAELRLDRLHPLDASVEIGDIEFVDRDVGLLAELPPRCVIMSVIGRDLVPGILQRARDGAADAADAPGPERQPWPGTLPNYIYRSRLWALQPLS